MPTAPAIVNDGDFRTARQNGAVTFEQPFAASRNDFDTFIARRTMRVETGYYVNPFPMAQMSFGNRGMGYLVDVTSPMVVAGTNLVEYDEVYASLPKTHREPGTASASIQVPYKLEDPGDPLIFRWQVLNLNDSFDAVYVYEYSLNKPLPQLFRARLVQIGRGFFGTATTNLQYFLAGFDFAKAPVDGLYLAQNSSSARWMGSIFVRESIYVYAPPVTKYNGLPASA